MSDFDKKIVLFIDDDEDDFLLMRDLMKECRPEIDLQWARDGEEGLARLNENGPNRMPLLIFLDLNMPKLNGREVLKQIRANDGLKHIPVVVLTNSMNKKEALEAYRLGVNSFIRKPSGYKELRDFVTLFGKYWFDYSTLQ